MNIKQLRKEIVVPVLKFLDLYSKQAEDLVIGTACQESLGGEYIRQLNCNGNIGAFGIYQCELNTYEDLITNFLSYKPELKNKLEQLRTCLPIQIELCSNLAFATAVCRLHYYRIKEPIPVGIYAQAQYWKKYYNTELGKGTIEEYISNYNKFN